MPRHIFLDWAFVVISAEKLIILRDEGKVEGCIIRTCEGYGIDDNRPDGKVQQQVNIFRQIGMSFSLYQYAHAGLDAARQVAYFKARSLQYDPSILMGDYECYKNYFVDPQRFYEPLELATGFAAHSDALATLGKPTVNYGGRWVSQWSNLLPDVWKKRWLWDADYLYDWDWHTPSLWPTTWQQWRNRIAQIAMVSDPLYPTIGAQQFAGDIIPPGIGHKVDVSICDNDALFNAMFHGMPMPAVPGSVPPIPTVAYRVTNWPFGTFIKQNASWSSPNIQGGYRFAGAIVQVDESQSVTGWLKVTPGGWCDRRRVEVVA